MKAKYGTTRSYRAQKRQRYLAGLREMEPFWSDLASKNRAHFPFLSGEN